MIQLNNHNKIKEQMISTLKNAKICIEKINFDLLGKISLIIVKISQPIFKNFFEFSLSFYDILKYDVCK